MRYTEVTQFDRNWQEAKPHLDIKVYDEVQAAINSQMQKVKPQHSQFIEHCEVTTVD